MVLAYHLNFSAYGFWLPNDERGTNSDYVRASHLLQFGLAPSERPKRSVARKPRDVARRLEANRRLTYPDVKFTGAQALAIAQGFAEYVAKSGLIVYACCILPKHVHAVTARHRIDAEHMVGQLKAAATRRLIAAGLHPFQHLRLDPLPSPWGRGCTKIFLDSVAAIEREIDYVRTNPLKEGKREQEWSFVRAFDPRNPVGR